MSKHTARHYKTARSNLPLGTMDTPDPRMWHKLPAMKGRPYMGLAWSRKHSKKGGRRRRHRTRRA